MRENVRERDKGGGTEGWGGKGENGDREIEKERGWREGERERGERQRHRALVTLREIERK